MSAIPSSQGWWKKLKPFVAVIFLRFGMAGMAILAKFALNQGMSPYSFVVYRQTIAAVVFAPFAFFLERSVRPKLTLAILARIALLALLEPVMDQILFFSGMKYTTATFSAAICNTLPAWTFVMAWIFRLENVKIGRLHSQAKIVGTIITVGGAMIMTLIKGPVLPLSIKVGSHHQFASSPTQQNPIKGALMIIAGCFCWACFMILQAVTLKSYPAPLSLTSLICLMGAIQGGFVGLAAEWGNFGIWAIHFDSKLLAAVYGGVICSGVTYYIQGVIMAERGPVFVTAFSPLTMVIVACIGSFVLGEEMFLGRFTGAIVIVIGLYLVVWGKSKDQPPSKCEGRDQLPATDHLPTIAPLNTVNSTDISTTRVIPTDEPV